jgi:holin-like protein
MISGLALILAGQLLGETIAYVTGMPIPGPVIGMVLMVGFLTLRARFPFLARPAGDGALEKAGHGLLANLSLLFVPAGVGIVQRFDLISGYAFALAAALVLSTLISLLVGVAMFRLVARRSDPS